MQARIIFAAVSYAAILSASASAQSPPVVNNTHIGAVVPGDFVTGFFTGQGDLPITWSDFTFANFSPLIGATGSGPFHAATFDPETQLFSWDSTGSPHGLYEWRATATNQFGSDQGSLFVDMTFLPEVPEPAGLGLAALGWMGLWGFTGRR
jgi:hypothetical protein